MKFPKLKLDKETIGIGASVIGLGITIYEIHRRNLASAAAAAAANQPDLSAGSQYYQQPTDVMPAPSGTTDTSSGAGITLPDVPSYGTGGDSSTGGTTVSQVLGQTPYAPITAPIASGPVGVPISQTPTSRIDFTGSYSTTASNTHTAPVRATNFGYGSAPTTVAPTTTASGTPISNSGGSAIRRVSPFSPVPGGIHRPNAVNATY